MHGYHSRAAEITGQRETGTDVLSLPLVPSGHATGLTPRGFSDGGLDLGKRVFRQGFSSPEDLQTAIIRTDGYLQGRRSAGIEPVHKNPQPLWAGVGAC